MNQINLNDYINAKKGLPTVTDDALSDEIQKRQINNVFPLHVFNSKILPFIEALHTQYDIPRSYIGLSMLSAYSSAIGTAYYVKLNKIGDIYFPVWACLEGISSAGKSLIMNQVFKPHYSIQEELEEDWFNMIEGKTDDAIRNMPSRQLIYGEANIPTLIKDVMPYNPKGILQDADEILSWINGMNQLSKGGKEGTDEQFWMKSWNCKAHRKRLSGNKIFVIKRPFLSVFGGAQPSIMWKLFKNDRATTGFIFRLLFAIPEKNKIAEPNLAFDMPDEYEAIHHKCINSLYKGLPMNNDDESREMLLDHNSLRSFLEWSSLKVKKINLIKDPIQLEMEAGIMGKIKEYCIRFAGMLHLADKAYNHEQFLATELITVETMGRAIKLADYFFEAASTVTQRVNDSVIASHEVLRYAGYIKAGFSMQRIGDLEFKSITNDDTRRIKAAREVRKLIKQYPKIFHAEAK
jgi:hypothetical protein